MFDSSLFKTILIAITVVVSAKVTFAATSYPVHTCFFDSVYGSQVKLCHKGKAPGPSIPRPGRGDWINFDEDAGAWSASYRFQELAETFNSEGLHPSDLSDGYCQSVHTDGSQNSGGTLSENLLEALYWYRNELMMYGLEKGYRGCF